MIMYYARLDSCQKLRLYVLLMFSRGVGKRFKKGENGR